MALITVQGLKMEVGEQRLFDGMSFEIQEGDRVGLIGVNGAGKTTLFKLLTGEYYPTDGTVVVNKNVTIGYMEQHVCRNLERSAYDEVMTVFSELIGMEKELDKIEGKIQILMNEPNPMTKENPPQFELFSDDGEVNGTRK